MNRKTKQLNSLININQQKYRELLSQHKNILNDLMDLQESISNISCDIDKNNKTLIGLIENKSDDFLGKYKIFNDYIKSLLNELVEKNEENSTLQGKADRLDEKLISLKVESKGYELLAEQNKCEVIKLARDNESKEIDEIWLLSRR